MKLLFKLNSLDYYLANDCTTKDKVSRKICSAKIFSRLKYTLKQDVDLDSIRKVITCCNFYYMQYSKLELILGSYKPIVTFQHA